VASTGAKRRAVEQDPRCTGQKEQ